MRPEKTELQTLTAVQAHSFDGASSGFLSSWPREHALSDLHLYSFLGSAKHATVATARPDARATASPVGFLVIDESFWLASVDGLRLRNVRRTPWVAVVVVADGVNAKGEPFHAAVTAEGPARVHEKAERSEHWVRFRSLWAQKYHTQPDWAAAVIELNPAKLFSYAEGWVPPS